MKGAIKISTGLKLLAFDFGASNGRGILGEFDGQKLQMKEVHRFSNDPVRLPDGLHWDILRLFHEIKQGILKCVAQNNADLAGIGIDTWGVDFGLLGKSGELLGNPYHYRDERTHGMIEKAYEKMDKTALFVRTGSQFQPFNTIYQLLSMVVNNSPVLEKAQTMLLLPDLFDYFLCGEKASEFTIVSTTQLYDPKQKDWAWDVIDAMGIPRRIFTPITSAGTIRGKLMPSVAEELFVRQIPIIAVASHDTGSAVAAVPYKEQNAAFLSSGTWSLIGIETPEPIMSPKVLQYNLTNEGCANGTFRLLKNIAGLWIIQECKRFWDKEGTIEDYDQLTQRAYQADAFKAFIDPDDELFYSPGNMPEKVQQFCQQTGQCVPQSKGEIIRCVLESLALKYRTALQEIEETAGHSIDVIHIVGGGTQNKALCQFTADATHRPVIAGPVEATAIGNLLVQAIALGEIKDMSEARDIIRRSFPTEEYLPKDNELWDEAYQKYTKIAR